MRFSIVSLFLLTCLSLSSAWLRPKSFSQWHPQAGNGQSIIQQHFYRQRSAPLTSRSTRRPSNSSEDIINFVCRSGPWSPVAGAPLSTGRGQGKTCSRDDVALFLFCSYKFAANREIEACSRKQRSQLYCTLVLPFFFLNERAERLYLKSRPGRQAPVCGGWSLLLDLGRKVLDDCSFKRPFSSVCEMANGHCEISVRKDACSWHWFVRVALLAMSRSFSLKDMAATPGYKLACWEPELDAANQLYDVAGRWDIDDQCLATLKASSASVLNCAFTTIYAKLAKSNRNRGKNDNLLFNVLPNIYRTGKADLREQFFEPAFQRMADTVRKRRAVTGRAVVTCSGLKAGGQKAQEMLTSLMRLTLVNELRHANSPFSILTVFSMVNMVMPCCLHAYRQAGGTLNQ